MTIVDWFTRWPEAIPLEEMTALVRSWVSRFGVPGDITTDRGRQFTSQLWKELHQLLGIKSKNTTSYRPQCNGLVERLHRQLKGSLMARATSSWMDDLPLVMLGIRSAWRTELGCSPAELVYGSALAVPGSFVETVPRTELPSSEYVRDLFRTMSELNQTEMAHHAVPKVAVPASLKEAKYVYIRTDAVRPPLVRPYTGPFKVVEKSAKYVIVEKNGKTDSVSVDRLKPAVVMEDNNNKSEEQPLGEPPNSNPISDKPETTRAIEKPSYRDALLCDQEQDTRVTRSGRHSRPPDRFQASLLRPQAGGGG